MRLPGIILAFFFLLSFNTFSQDLKWAYQIGGIGDDEGYALTVDTWGNVYTIGFFEDKVDLNPDTGTSNLISKGYRDIFIHKLDSSGNLVWAKQLGGTGYDMGFSIAVDTAGNVVSTGYFADTAYFESDSGSHKLISNGGNDIFILKLDSSGNVVWIKQMGGTDSDIGSNLTIDKSGNIYVIGTFRKTVDFDPDSGIVNLTSTGGSDAFFLKLDTEGHLLWAKRLGNSASNDGGSYIRTDFNDNIYIRYAIHGYNYAMKLDANANTLWTKKIGGFENYSISSLEIDISGNVYMCGSFKETVDFDPDSGIYNLTSDGYFYHDLFIQKLDSLGNFEWVKQIGGSYYDFCTSLALNAAGNIFVTGFFSETVDFDPGLGIFNLSHTGQIGGTNDVFILNLDSDGNFVWARQIGGSSNDEGRAVTVDKLGNVYTTGYFQGTVDFDPGTGIANLTSKGRDVFIQKLGASDSIILFTDHTNLSSETVAIFPNPTTSNCVLRLVQNYSTIYVKIFDLAGKLIFSNAYYQTQLIELETEFPDGIYFVSVYSDNVKNTLKLIKN